MSKQLVFRYGAMNSGKSAELLRVANNYEEQNKWVMLFTSKKDNRYSYGTITSRIGVSHDADLIYEGMYDYIKEQNPQCVLTDEAQFYTREQVNELAKVVTELNIPVICYGLKVDFNGNLFEGSKRLMELAHKIEEIKTMCWYTDHKANMNVRMSEGEPIFEGNQVEVGGNDMYIPVCLSCFLKLKEKYGG